METYTFTFEVSQFGGGYRAVIWNNIDDRLAYCGAKSFKSEQEAEDEARRVFRTQRSDFITY